MNYGTLELWTPEVGERRSRETALTCLDPSLTVQSEAEDADINVIMKRFGVTGNVSQVGMPPSFGDFEFAGDYRSALDLIRSADQSFLELPAEVRSRFSNDPARFLDWVYSPDRKREDLVAAGLAPPLPAEPAPQKVEIVNQKAPEGGTPAGKS